MTDERFLAPADMSHELRERAASNRATAGHCRADRGRVDGGHHRQVIESIPYDDGHDLRGIRVFGGGSRSSLLRDALQRRTPLPVSVGPVEATAIGNALVQGVALGLFADADDGACDTGRPTGGRVMNVQALERLELMRRRLDTEGRVRVAELAANSTSAR